MCRFGRESTPDDSPQEYFRPSSNGIVCRDQSQKPRKKNKSEHLCRITLYVYTALSKKLRDAFSGTEEKPESLSSTWVLFNAFRIFAIVCDFVGYTLWRFFPIYHAISLQNNALVILLDVLGNRNQMWAQTNLNKFANFIFFQNVPSIGRVARLFKVISAVPTSNIGYQLFSTGMLKNEHIECEKVYIVTKNLCNGFFDIFTRNTFTHIIYVIANIIHTIGYDDPRSISVFAVVRSHFI